MFNVNDVIKVLEDFAPLNSAQSWDNAGWQINLGIKESKKLMLCLSLTPQILSQALENECNFIITHHPLIFNSLKNISYNTVSEKLLIDCIKNNIQVYSAHTNLDCANGGVNDTLCEKLGVIPFETVYDFVKIAEFSEEMPLDSFILKLKISLNAPKIKIINPQNKQTIKRIAICAGSGGDFINLINNVDAYITGDVKYHTALDVQNMILIDAGHFETERMVLHTLKNLLQTITPEIIIAKESQPWVIV